MEKNKDKKKITPEMLKKMEQQKKKAVNNGKIITKNGNTERIG